MSSISEKIFELYENPKNRPLVCEFIKAVDHNIVPFTTFKNPKNQSFLWLAAYYGDIEMVRELLKYKHDFLQADSTYNYTVLMSSVSGAFNSNCATIILLLLDKMNATELGVLGGYYRKKLTALFMFLKRQLTAYNSVLIIEKFITKMSTNDLKFCFDSYFACVYFGYDDVSLAIDAGTLIQGGPYSPNDKMRLLTLLHNKCYPSAPAATASTATAAGTPAASTDAKPI